MFHLIHFRGEILKELFLFNGLTVTDAEKAISLVQAPKHFKKGDVIYSAESFSHAIGYILSGKAVAVANNGSLLHMNTFEKGACFGVAAVFGNETDYVSSVIAKSECEILFITEEELEKIFSLFPVCSINYIKFLSERIRFLNKKLDMLSRPCAEDTVYNYLSSSKDADGIAKIPKSMTLVAKTLGIGRATLYRSLDALENKGKILRENNYIKVI